MARHENLYHPCPKPTFKEINDYACSLAKADGRYSSLIRELIHWPTWVTPPDFSPRMAETVFQHGCYIKRIKEQAKAILTEDMAKLPREKIKRTKKRKQPNRKRYWTRWPTKHGQTPPGRRRGFVVRTLPTRRTLAPPGEYTFEETPSRCPSRHEREVLLFPDPGCLCDGWHTRRFPPKMLFDIRIAI